MKLFLVRHGETDANRILGHAVAGPMHNEPVAFAPGQDTNISLNVYGRSQALEACENLPSVISDIYASPLLRVKETAEIIADNKKFNRTNIKFNEGLVEYYQGSLDGLSSEEKKRVTQGIEYGSGLLCNYDYTPWGGDSWKVIHERIKAFLEYLKNEHNDSENVVCVTSAGVIRMIYKIFFENKAPHISKHINIGNGSVHEFNLE